jgi:hypothetical protein
MMQAVATVAATEAWAGSPQCPQVNCHRHVLTKYGSVGKYGQNVRTEYRRELKTSRRCSVHLFPLPTTNTQ